MPKISAERKLLAGLLLAANSVAAPGHTHHTLEDIIHRTGPDGDFPFAQKDMSIGIVHTKSATGICALSARSLSHVLNPSLVLAWAAIHAAPSNAAIVCSKKLRAMYPLTDGAACNLDSV